MTLMVYSYGKRRTGKWITLAEGGTALEVGELKPRTSDTFEASYIVSRKALSDFRKWQTEFDPVSFNTELASKIAKEAGVSPDSIKILWWEFNNQASPPYLNIQVEYIPEMVGTLPAKVGVIGWVAIFSAMAVTTYLTSAFAFSTQPKLDSLKYLLEQVNVALKYGIYLVLASGGVYLLAKFLPRLLKKEK